MKVSVITIGCRTNQSESQYFKKEVLSNRHNLVDLEDYPDICIINTCSVTSKADSQSRQTIYKALKYANKVVVTGCYIELNNKDFKELERVLIYSNNDKMNINNLLKQNIFLPDNHHNTLNFSRPIIKVQEGCNDSCSYCSIINARGRARSIDKEEIIKRIKEYSKDGFSEVVLSGTNIGQYGLDLSYKIDIYTLIADILFKTDIKKIRISSLEIKYVNDSLLELMKDDRICKHLHIPLQSGDNNVLKSMKRPYDIEEYEYKINKIRTIFENISIGTDIIVGYPTELNEYFDNSLHFINKMSFSYLHVFPFSKRKNTDAFSMPLCYKPQDLKRRILILKKLSYELRDKFIRSQMGRVLDFLIEKRRGNNYFGTTDNYIKSFIFDKNSHQEKTIIKIKLTEHKNILPSGISIT